MKRPTPPPQQKPEVVEPEICDTIELDLPESGSEALEVDGENNPSVAVEEDALSASVGKDEAPAANKENMSEKPSAQPVDSPKGTPLAPRNTLSSSSTESRPKHSSKGEAFVATPNFDDWITKQREQLGGLNDSIAQMCMPTDGPTDMPNLANIAPAPEADYESFEEWEKAKRAELAVFQGQVVLGN